MKHTGKKPPIRFIHRFQGIIAKANADIYGILGMYKCCVQV